MPGRHINDHQMRLYMKFRHSDGVATAAAKAGFSTATGYQIAHRSAATIAEDRCPGTAAA